MNIYVILKYVYVSVFVVYLLISSKLSAWEPVYDDETQLVLENKDNLLRWVQGESVEEKEITPLPNIVGLVVENELKVKVGENGLFPVSSANLGASGVVTIKPDKRNLPLHLSVCETDPKKGTCLDDFTKNISIDYSNGETASFAIFYHAYKPIKLNYAKSRIFIRYVDKNTGEPVGVTSIVMSTE